MKEHQYYQMLNELISCSSDEATRERLNAWRKKYIQEFGIRELIDQQRLDLMNDSEGFVQHYWNKMFHMLGKAVGTSPFAVTSDVILKDDDYRKGMRQLEAKIFLFGTKDKDENS